MIKVMCDKCGNDCGAVWYEIRVGVIHNPTSLYHTDSGNAKLTDDNTRYRFILCQKCFSDMGFPNPYTVKENEFLCFREPEGAGRMVMLNLAPQAAAPDFMEDNTMLKPGIYRHRHEIEYGERTFYAGDIVLEVHETKTAFVLTLLEQQVRYDAPQIDDMFQKSKRVVIKKDGSKHAMSFCDDRDDWFCIYPYRVGVPYEFTNEDSIKETEEYLRKCRFGSSGCAGKPAPDKTERPS